MQQDEHNLLRKDKIKWWLLLLNLAVPLAVGGISAIITHGSMQHFDALNTPPLTPPGWLFPVVWPLLFVLMGVGSYLVWESKSRVKQKALMIYAVQLFFNFFWSVLFFNLSFYLPAFFWLLLLLVLLFLMFYYFWLANPTAAYLQIPYIIWVIFAGYLNLGIYFLNR